MHRRFPCGFRNSSSPATRSVIASRSFQPIPNGNPGRFFPSMKILHRSVQIGMRACTGLKLIARVLNAYHECTKLFTQLHYGIC